MSCLLRSPYPQAQHQAQRQYSVGSLCPRGSLMPKAAVSGPRVLGPLPAPNLGRH